MKFQCSCGEKFAFDVTPDMVQRPVSFVCPTCGQDSSAAVNEIIRQQFAVPAPAPTVLVPAAPVAATPHVRVHQASTAVAGAAGPVGCPKHRGQLAHERCVLCGKPICPMCMKMFGYVCSPMCRQKAELSGMEIPEYELSNAVLERKYQRKLTTTILGIVGGLALIIGVWIWYLVIGSQPRPAYIARFNQPAYSGKIHLIGKNQLVVIHGGTLSRHDVSAEKQLWSASLVDRTKLLTEAQTDLREMEDALRRAQLAGKNTERYKLPTPEALMATLERDYAADLELHVRGEKVWIAQPDKLVRYDWDTGKPAQEVAVSFGFGGAEVQDDDLVALRESANGEGELTRVNLLTGQATTDKFRASTAGPTRDPLAKALGANNAAANRALDPNRLASQVQRMPIQGRLALPATISIQQGQNRILQEMDEMDNGPARPAAEEPRKADLSEHITMLATKSGPVEFSRQMIEERLIERAAMKAAPRKSALDGPVNMNSTVEVANELLNEIQRTRGMDKIIEDESLYRVAVRLPGKDGAPEWKSELSGPPSFHPLKTVNLVIAGKSVVALDTRNRKLWEHTLSHQLSGHMGEALHDGSGNVGTIAEREGVVLIADQGVLTALDGQTGNVRWRFPAVGISGLFYDDAGMLYVNATTADPDSVKYSRQIDVTKPVNSLIVKLNPKDGTTLWRNEAMGAVTHVSGKFVYTLDASAPDEAEDAHEVFGLTPPKESGYVRIRRINPGNGGTKWEYEQKRAPLDVEFAGRSIQILFPTEAQVLRFLSF